MSITHQGTFEIDQKLDTITVLGAEKPSTVRLDGKAVEFAYVDGLQKLTLSNLSINLNHPVVLLWS